MTAPAGRRGAAAASLPLAGGFSPPGMLAMQNGHQIQPVPYDLLVFLGLQRASYTFPVDRRAEFVFQVTLCQNKSGNSSGNTPIFRWDVF